LWDVFWPAEHTAERPLKGLLKVVLLHELQELKSSHVGNHLLGQAAKWGMCRWPCPGFAYQGPVWWRPCGEAGEPAQRCSVLHGPSLEIHMWQVGHRPQGVYPVSLGCW
jgi:hypothetical protein